MNKLEHLEIILTRPIVQATAWASQLVQEGALVIQVPLLAIDPVQQEEQLQTIKNKILNLDHYQKIIFVSQNAVTFGMEWIDRYWPQIPIKLDFFVVGSATAQVLESYDVNVKNLAQDAASAMTSETLLQHPDLERVSGEKILIVRGVGGRGLMGDVLEERGARVDYCEVYQRSLPADASLQLCQVFGTATTRSHRVVTLQSGETLENFVRILKDWPIDVRNSAYNATLVVPSERVATMASQMGFNHLVTAANATDSAMRAALFSVG